MREGFLRSTIEEVTMGDLQCALNKFRAERKSETGVLGLPFSHTSAVHNAINCVVRTGKSFRCKEAFLSWHPS